MSYVKKLDLPAEDIVTVSIPAADAARAKHGNVIYAALLAKAQATARSASPRRVMADDYTTSVEASGAYAASFALVPT